jgi:hypothetical protein
MRRLTAAAALSASLLLAACQNPDGSTDWGNTLLLGAGVGTAAALVAGAAADQPQPHYGRGGGYRHRPAYYGHRHGPGRYGYGHPHRRW